MHALSGPCFEDGFASWVNVPLASTSSQSVRQPRDEFARSVACATPFAALTQEIGFAFGIEVSVRPITSARSTAGRTSICGLYWARTSDLSDVNAAL